MARIHYRDGRWEEVPMPYGLEVYDVAKFAPRSLEPWDVDPRGAVIAERITFQAAEYAYQTEVDPYMVTRPELMEAAWRFARQEGVPEYAEHQEPERDIFHDTWILMARWFEYFEIAPPLPREKLARLRERRRRFLENHGRFLRWLRKVRRVQRQMWVCWHEAKRIAVGDPVAKLGPWSSLWPENVR